MAFWLFCIFIFPLFLPTFINWLFSIMVFPVSPFFVFCRSTLGFYILYCCYHGTYIKHVIDKNNPLLADNLSLVTYKVSTLLLLPIILLMSQFTSFMLYTLIIYSSALFLLLFSFNLYTILDLL